MGSLKPFCIGLTGGIGSGKSTVADLFSKLGVPIIDADVVAHRITQPNTQAYDRIASHFGQTILQTDNTINRKKLRELVFKNTADRKWLENLLHPIIRQTMKEEIKKVKKPYCICVIPLLAEAVGIDYIDRVLVVDAPLEEQMARAKKRDGATDAAIQKIIQSQISREGRLAIADDVLMNDGDIVALEEKVQALHQRYLKSA